MRIASRPTRLARLALDDLDERFVAIQMALKESLCGSGASVALRPVVNMRRFRKDGVPIAYGGRGTAERSRIIEDLFTLRCASSGRHHQRDRCVRPTIARRLPDHLSRALAMIDPSGYAPGFRRSHPR